MFYEVPGTAAVLTKHGTAAVLTKHDTEAVLTGYRR